MADEWCSSRSPKITRPDGTIYLFCLHPYGHEGRCSWDGRRPRGHAVEASLVDGGDWEADPVVVELPEG